jgi:hypothetical protein
MALKRTAPTSGRLSPNAFRKKRDEKSTKEGKGNEKEHKEVRVGADLADDGSVAAFGLHSGGMGSRHA